MSLNVECKCLTTMAHSFHHSFTKLLLCENILLEKLEILFKLRSTAKKKKKTAKTAKIAEADGKTTNTFNSNFFLQRKLDRVIVKTSKDTHRLDVMPQALALKNISWAEN